MTILFTFRGIPVAESEIEKHFNLRQLVGQTILDLLNIDLKKSTDSIFEIEQNMSHIMMSCSKILQDDSKYIFQSFIEQMSLTKKPEAMYIECMVDYLPQCLSFLEKNYDIFFPPFNAHDVITDMLSDTLDSIRENLKKK